MHKLLLEHTFWSVSSAQWRSTGGVCHCVCSGLCCNFRSPPTPLRRRVLHTKPTTVSYRSCCRQWSALCSAAAKGRRYSVAIVLSAADLLLTRSVAGGRNSTGDRSRPQTDL